MTAFDALKIAAIVFSAAVLQTSVFADVVLLGSSPDLLLVALVAVALARGALAGAIGGFLGGLVTDVALLGTLGATSLLLTLVGYWTGRYGETTARDRRYAPYLAVAVLTLLYLLGSLGLRFMLAEPAPVRAVLLDTVVQAVVLNVLLMWPVYALVSRLLPRRDGVSLGSGVSVLG